MFEGEQRRQAILVALSVIFLVICGAFLLAGRAVSAQTIPDVPILLSPSGASFTTTITFDWGEVPGADDYQLLVVQDGVGPVYDAWHLAGDVCSAGICSVTPPAPLALGAHTWYVRARNTAGATWSPSTWFHVAAQVAPAPATLGQPKGTITGNQPTYLWFHEGSAVDYQLLVIGADTVQYINTWYLAVDICNGVTCTVPQASPLPEQGYSWYVRARNPYGAAWSSAQFFNVFSGSKPVAPTLTAPTGVVSDTTPAFTWTDEGDARDYNLILVNSQPSLQLDAWYLAADICDGAICSVTLPAPLPDDTYSWYLRARNPAGVTWGIGKWFILFTGGPVGPATPLTPTGTIGEATPTYTWGEGTDATHYQLLILDGGGSLVLAAWHEAADICAGGSCQVTPAVVLPEGNYSWIVKSRNPLGAVYSPRLYFTVEPLPPDLELVKDNPVSGAFPGDTITYTLTYSNTGGKMAAGVVLSDTVPENSSFYPAGSSPGWTQVGATDHYTYSLGSLAVNARGVVTFAITVDDPLPPAVETITNTASISDDGSQGPDPTPGNNEAVETTPIYGGPTNVCGTLTADTVWTRLDSPYIVNCDVTVSSGITLTVEAGAVIKFQNGTHLDVFGNLLAQGITAQPIHFTSLKDDSIGGDSNGDGNATQPAPGDYSGIRVDSGGSATINYAIARYGGG